MSKDLKLDPPSTEFEESFSDHCGGCVRDCDCGRTLFDTENIYDWNDGELEELQVKAKKHPDKYIALSYSVSTCTVGGKEFVMGCPCNGLRKYENFILSHAEQIANYLNKRVELLKKKAAAITCNAVPPIIKEGWKSMESAPKNATNVHLLLNDGRTCEGHFAQDLSGEEQPRFSGWFKPIKNDLGQTIHFEPVIPVAWSKL